MTFKTLKRTRVLVGLLFFVLITSVFLDIYELYPEGMVGKVLFLQLVPSMLLLLKALSWGALGFVVILLLNLLLGRIYCSTVCPLGILQDLVAFIAKKRSGRSKFYKKKKAYPWLRYALLGVTVLTVFMAFNTVLSLLDPYSNFGRIITYLFRPVLMVSNNVAAAALQKFEIYSLNPMKVVWAPWFVLLIVLGLLLTVIFMSYKRGRLFCNTICPVGTLLGLLSKISVFKIRFIESRCTRCAACIGVCKSECIDVKNLKVDHTRCVDCFNCLAVCPESALTIRSQARSKVSPAEGTGASRRNLIASGVALLLGHEVLAEMKKPKDTSKMIPNKKDYPVSPPGSIGIRRFNEICTACGLCVAECPTKVLQPAIRQYGLQGFMQPHMDYLSGLCNYDCKRCSEVCPTGAIMPVSIDEKRLTQMGKAVFVKENCVVYTDSTDCGACSEHCPTKAVDMVPYKGKLRIPEVNQDICIGCGACEHPCPVDVPYKAIYVNGNAVHQVAQKPKEEDSQVVPVEEDFPF